MADGIHMLMYDQKFLSEIRQKVPLCDYIQNSGLINLKQHRNRWSGSCCKHKDDTPSFFVDGEKNVFKCFSCGRSGDLFSFMQQYEGLTFNQAVQRGMRLAGMAPDQLCQSPSIHLLRSMQIKPHFTYQHKILSESELNKYTFAISKDWFDEGINMETQKEFEVHIDYRNNRIIYPVRDIYGRLINIKGRTKDPDYKLKSIPKYINYFSVGVLDYFQSLDKTKDFIKEKKEMIIFESVKSVMKAWQWGYKNCVSAEQHSLTDEQIDLIAKLGVDVVLAYDSDIDYYKLQDVRDNIRKLKMVTNVYVIRDLQGRYLGGSSAKAAPVDCGLETWQILYMRKERV